LELRAGSSISDGEYESVFAACIAEQFALAACIAHHKDLKDETKQVRFVKVTPDVAGRQ
jgi:hypothetical protein